MRDNRTFSVKIFDHGALAYAGTVTGTPEEIVRTLVPDKEGWVRFLTYAAGEGFIVGPGFTGIIAIAEATKAVEGAPDESSGS
jgi:hypothetical protein